MRTKSVSGDRSKRVKYTTGEALSCLNSFHLVGENPFDFTQNASCIFRQQEVWNLTEICPKHSSSDPFHTIKRLWEILDLKFSCSQPKRFLPIVLGQTWKMVNQTLSGTSTGKCDILCTSFVFLDRKCEVASSSSSSAPPLLKYIVQSTEAMKWCLLSWGRLGPPKGSIQSVQHSRWTTLSPLFSLFGKNTERLTGLWVTATWRYRLRPSQGPAWHETGSPAETPGPTGSAKGAKSREASPSSSTGGKQNTANRWIRGIASRWIYKGIVAVDCTEFQLLL